MNVYPIKFRAADGTTFAGELVTEMSLQNQLWELQPLANGIEYSGASPSVLWSALPNLLNQNASFSTNIATTYATPSTGITLQIVVNGVPGAALPTGLTFNTGTNLFAYNGTSVFGLTTISFLATLTATGQVFASGTFTISGSGSTSADVTAPTIPVGIAVSSLTATSATLSGVPSSDPSPPGANWTGMGQYNVTIPGAPGSPFTVGAPTPGPQPILTPGDVGSQTSTVTQSGADVSFTTTATDSPFPTASALAAAYKQLAGTSWWMRARVPAAFTSTGVFDNLRLEARTNLTPGSPYAAIVCTNLAAPQRQVQSESRAAAGGSATGISSAALAAAQKVDLFVNRNLDTYSFFYSLDGNTLQPLGTITQAMGSTLYVTAGANTASGGPMTAQTLQQFSVNTDPLWSLNLTGLTPLATYSATVTAQDAASPPNISAPSNSVSFTTASVAVGAVPFPRPAIWGGAGSQNPITSAQYAAFAQYPMILIGGDFPSAVGGARPTRGQVVGGIKGQPLTGKCAVLPQVYQYQNLPDFVAGGNQTEWQNKAFANNWVLYLNGSSGTLQVSGDGKQGYAVPSHGGGNGGSIAAIAKDTATGLWPYEWAIQYMHDRYIGTGLLAGGSLATGTSLATMGSAQLDGLWVDNPTIWMRVSGDWNRSGVTSNVPGTGEAAVMNALLSGQADLGKQFRVAEAKAGTSRKIIGNTSQFATAAYAIDGTPMNKAFNYTMQQFVFGRGPSAVWQFHNFAYVMARYKELIAASIDGTGFLSAQWGSSDFQAMRHAICFTLMDNGYLLGGVWPTGTGSSDYVDPANASTFPLCDEFWGGALSLGGYLGSRIGAVQTAPASNGIWRADFDNGIVLVNSTQAPATIALGGTFFHLRSAFGSQAINNAASATSATLGTFNYDSSCSGYAGHPIVTGDACILMRTPT